MTKDRSLTPPEQRLWRYVTQKGARPSTILPDKTTQKPPIRGGAIDPHTYQKLAAGTIAISGRVDLHGLTLEQAHIELLHYVQCAQAHGAHFVLVITGKGKPATPYLPDDHRGTLRQMVPRWLCAAPFIECVADVAAASPKHGGDGALYVRLKRV